MHIVLVVVPGCQDQASLILTLKPLKVQALVPNPTIEALDIGVLDGFSRPDEGVRDTALVDSELQGLTRELQAVVGGDRLRRTPEKNDCLQNPNDVMACDGDTDVHHQKPRVKSSTTVSTRNRYPEAS